LWYRKRLDERGGDVDASERMKQSAAVSLAIAAE
jgi:hypothetical protein